jgi:pyruvate dehydrogenase E2 component (dihydrolipoamide acetyltransferase)
MAISVVMPALEMAQETGKLISWLKQEGESVRKGEMLVEVETDKAVVEVEALADGILAGVTAKPGDVVHVGPRSHGSYSPVKRCRSGTPHRHRRAAPPRVAASPGAAPTSTAGARCAEHVTHLTEGAASRARKGR